MKKKTTIVLLCFVGLTITVIIVFSVNFNKPSEQTINIDSKIDNEVIGAKMAKDIHIASEHTRSIFPADWNMSHEVERAVTKGAPAKITLKVVDSIGRAVSNAQVMLNFTFYERKNSFLEGVTDDQGFFTGQKETMSACNWSIKKNGHYSTVGQYSFMQRLSNDSIKDGRWQPWNPIIEVVLKEKRHIRKGIFDYVNINTPKDTVIGFDCLKGDWQPPVGQGVHADIMFLYRSDYNGTFGYLTNSLTISTQGALDGFIKYKQDAFSKYWSIYDAPKNGYQPLLVFEQARTLYKMSKNTILEDDEYLVFCSTREDGNKYYGKIRDFKYGEDYKKKGHGFVKFEYHLNPTPNDRRLEIEK